MTRFYDEKEEALQRAAELARDAEALCAAYLTETSEELGWCAETLEEELGAVRAELCRLADGRKDVL